MSSLVVFPFKTERPEVVLSNVESAAGHHSVGEVLCVGHEEESTYRAIADNVDRIEEATGTGVTLLLQDRIGLKRRGKGDGMNTALLYFLDSNHDRIHFYDADITSFDSTWMTKAEQAADMGYDTVRHYFPRAATDAMITWMVTRTGFSILFPQSELPWIEQPLGGEFLLSRSAAEAMAGDPAVQAQSDWGIDTLLTFSAVRHGMSIFEVYIPQGKIHALYGQLTDIRTMIIECFAALQGLRDADLPGTVTHHIAPPEAVPSSIAGKVAYDVEATMRLIPESWSGRQAELFSLFPDEVRTGMLGAGSASSFSFMDEWAWYEAFQVLLDEYVEGDPDWEELLFHLWMVRVLAYTSDVATHGYEHAVRYLRGMIHRYLYRSITGKALPDGD